MTLLIRFWVFVMMLSSILFGIVQGPDSKSLRIAAFFSGRVRGYEYNRWLLPFLEQYSIDTFCSINGELDEYHQTFIDKYHIKKHYFQPYQLAESFQEFEKNKHPVVSINNVCSMFYNHKKNIELIAAYQKEKGFQYDLVLYLRTDSVKGYDFLPLVQQDLVNQGYVCIPEPLQGFWKWNRQYITGYNDQLACASFDTMVKYCSLYDHLEEYYFQDHELFHPEHLLYVHLSKQMIPVYVIPWSTLLHPRRKR